MWRCFRGCCCQTCGDDRDRDDKDYKPILKSNTSETLKVRSYMMSFQPMAKFGTYIEGIMPTSV